MAAAAAADAAAAARLPGAVSHIPEDRLPAVREAFRTFDTAGAGDIAVDELAGVLRALRYTVNQTELAEFAERYSADGRIGYEQVLHVVGTVHNRRRGPAAMVAAFRVRLGGARALRSGPAAGARGGTVAAVTARRLRSPRPLAHGAAPQGPRWRKSLRRSGRRYGPRPRRKLGVRVSDAAATRSAPESDHLPARAPRCAWSEPRRSSTPTAAV